MRKALISLICFVIFNSVFSQNLNWLENDLFTFGNNSQSLLNANSNGKSYILSASVLPAGHDGWIELTNFTNSVNGTALDLNDFINLNLTLTSEDIYNSLNVLNNGYQISLHKKITGTGNPIEFCIDAYNNGTDTSASSCGIDNVIPLPTDTLKIEKIAGVIYFKYNNQLVDQININDTEALRIAIDTKSSDEFAFNYTYNNFVITAESYTCLQVDDNGNWISNCNYDLNGALVSSNVGFFNSIGKPVQSQSLDIKTGKIWSNETRYDTHGRPAFQTLSAPIGYNNQFVFNSNFIKKSNGSPYSNSDFENNINEPEEVGDDDNTLGWYYSNQNTSEPYQDITEYPFTRTIYDELNPGKTLKVLGGNKVNQVQGLGGEWINGFSHSMPAAQELYYAYGTEYFDIFNGGNSQIINHKVIKSVSIDTHGNEIVSFSDLEGKQLAVAKSNGPTKYEVISLIGEQGYVDVHIPKGIQNGDIEFLNSGTYTIYDLRTSAVVNSSQMTGGNVYRIESDFQPGNVLLDNYQLLSSTNGIKYKVNYYDFSLNFYDDAGNFKYSVQPKGFDVNAFNQLSQKPNHEMISSTETDALGRVLSSTSPDQGSTSYIYREDGQIRYSQNTLQAINDEFSYTRYDERARPVESGVYFGPLDFNGHIEANLVNFVGTKEGVNKSITKIGKESWYCGVATVVEIQGEGGISYNVPSNDKSFMIGLSSDNSGATQTTIDYAIYNYEGGYFKIYKLGSAQGDPNNNGSQNFGTYEAGDNFKIKRNTSNNIEFYKNDQLVHTIADNVQSPLIADMSFYTPESYITNFDFFGNTQVASGAPDFVNLNNVSVNGTTIRKNTGATNSWSHGFTSRAAINGDGSFSWTVGNSNSKLMVGLSAEVGIGYYSTYFEYAFYQKSDGVLAVYERGKSTTIGPYSQGTNLSIERSGNIVSYYVDNDLVYTSNRASINEQLLVKGTIYYPNDEIQNVSLEGGSKLFKDYKAVRALTTANGSTVSKYAHHSYNADVSTDVAITGAGYLQFEVPQTDKTLFVGLSGSNINTHYNTIDYAMYLTKAGYIHAREGGTNTGNSIGTYVAGDVFKIDRDTNGMIRFYQNNIEIYSSPNTGPSSPSTGSLYLDTSFVTPFAEIHNIELVNSEANVVSIEEDLPDNYCKEQTFTLYDEKDESSLHNALTPYGIVSHYKRQNFVAGAVSKSYTSNPQTSTTWYNYDIYGRVVWMVQNINGLGVKTIDYDYDPISGNLLKVYYQKHIPNETFIHRYNYNDFRQLESVDVSTSNQIFSRKADYIYYEDGSLKRVVLANGEQGIDYVYNLSGALKSINHPELDTAHDPGGDYNDVFGMIIDYHDGDYRRGNTHINTDINQGLDRFDGNIKATRWATSSINNGEQNAYVYNYNDNKWLTQAQFGLNTNGNVILNNNFLVSNISYDSNGNIQALKRNNATGAKMDDFSYHYKPETNQLDYVNDAISPSSSTNDLNSQSPNNYQYNAIGQLSDNVLEGWNYKYNASGLVAQAVNGDYTVRFDYDDRGQRVLKHVITDTDEQKTYYTRDAAGNIMGVYYGSQSNNSLNTPALHELPMYGANKRIGSYNRQRYYYELTDHLGNVRAVIGESGNGNSTVDIYNEDFNNTSSTSPWQTVGASSLSIHNGALQCDTPSNYDGMSLDVSVVAGNTYHVQANIQETHISGSINVNVKSASSGVIYEEFNLGTGLVSFTFTPLFTETVFLRFDQTNLPQSSLFWVDNVAISDITNTQVNVIAHTDYYPFGMPMPDRNLEGNYRYKFQGQEKDPETDKEAFELRLWDGRIGRWLTTDPYGQYASPYLGMGNDPINGVDPDGGLFGRQRAWLYKLFNGGRIYKRYDDKWAWRKGTGHGSTIEEGLTIQYKNFGYGGLGKFTYKAHKAEFSGRFDIGFQDVTDNGVKGHSVKLLTADLVSFKTDFLKGGGIDWDYIGNNGEVKGRALSFSSESGSFDFKGGVNYVAKDWVRRGVVYGRGTASTIGILVPTNVSYTKIKQGVGSPYLEAKTELTDKHLTFHIGFQEDWGKSFTPKVIPFGLGYKFSAAFQATYKWEF